MKKSLRGLSVFLSVALCMSLAGCRGGEDAGSSGTSPAESTAASLAESRPDAGVLSGGESEISPDSLAEASAAASSGTAEKPESPAQGRASETGSDSTASTVPGEGEASTAGPDSAASSAPEEVETVRLTFAEGVTVARIADTLEAKGITTGDRFFQAVEALDVSGYPLAAAIQPSAQRCFRLEGYLFPDTYDFYVGESPESVIARMLSNTEARIPQSYRDRAAELGLTMDEALTLASIIQKEAPTHQMAAVSSVLHNRLDAGMRLQCDVTIKYVEGAIKPYISGDINRYNAYYNTYKCAALPAGAICNPGLAALKAALWPEDSGYLYFAFDTSGNYYYSETYEEHLQQCQDAGIAVGGES